MGPLLDSVQQEQGSIAAQDVMTAYIEKHTGHTPALRMALQHARHHWPLNTQQHVTLMIVCWVRGLGVDSL